MYFRRLPSVVVVVATSGGSSAEGLRGLNPAANAPGGGVFSPSSGRNRSVDL